MAAFISILPLPFATQFEQLFPFQRVAEVGIQYMAEHCIVALSEAKTCNPFKIFVRDENVLWFADCWEWKPKRWKAATFSSLIICQSVQIEITLSKTTKLRRRGDELQENKMQSLSRPCQKHNLLQKDLWSVDVEKRKAEDLSEDGIGKNVLSTLRRGSGVVWGVNGVKYALLDDA